MKKLLAKVKNSRGFVSLETIGIAMIVIGIAGLLMLKFKGTVTNASDQINDQIQSNVQNIKTDGTYTGK